ncbi:uncharacterized protein LOC123013061 [Tribolium madens]|uniref:uncharacterized protein LOC123013061 n=1 Tax=Tribolium madens TaxID=41895 RepID=UPI001CF74924|nr:uncharacterized protein LOC123013061 [Tribolium madens]XP_044267310.1 uncharacterized protein LOC123013061 [Tribolium madens]XP_044267311.1 uncharacterized protein LOC123013061 [Tribolium madens]XP_044267312.1 uncharacterized protein LOC123013061 [Tribolium madens]
MEQRLSNFRSLFKSSPAPQSDPCEPEIGFKLTFSKTSKQLKVKVLSARHLPANYGTIKPRGYSVKITVFPEKEKYETSVVKESWPTFNEEFPFTLHSTSKYYQDYFKGKFISFTVYAVLENATETMAKKNPTSKLRRFFSFSEFGETPNRFRRSFRHSLNSRRTVGAVTYNLDAKIFNHKLGDDLICTPDIWRGIKEITSGIQTEPREGKNGSVEMTLSYAISEDRKNDVVEISITKFRCSLQTMQQHEKLGGQLYIKITASEQDDLIQKMKSDKFEPTISLKLEANTATLRATVNNDNLEQVRILVRLICKNILGKKIVLGKIEIDSNSDLWKEIVRTPSVPITRMINLE